MFAHLVASKRWCCNKWDFFLPQFGQLFLVSKTMSPSSKIWIEKKKTPTRRQPFGEKFSGHSNIITKNWTYGAWLENLWRVKIIAAGFRYFSFSLLLFSCSPAGRHKTSACWCCCCRCWCHIGHCIAMTNICKKKRLVGFL